MARVSFTLRKTDADPDLGSYLRYEEGVSYESSGPGGTAASVGSRIDYDNALRADGIQIAPEEFEESFFQATSVCYGEVSLDWGVNIEPATAAPTPTGVVLVYSPTGEPQTIAAGDILVESTSTYEFEHTGLPEGKWAYYSLFVHYQSTGGDNYYERVASLAIIVPKNYGSTLQLWERIPEYYRIQDTELGDFDYSPCIGDVGVNMRVGPLFKMLSIIGFDIDRIRTIIDYLMVAKDPLIANSETLAAISEQMAAKLKVTDLGPQRLRSLLGDVGYFRRTKGTLVGTEFFARSLSGSGIELDSETGDITVYSQRTNYITVPKTGFGILSHRAAGDIEQDEDEQLPFSDTTYAAYSGSYNVSGNNFTTTGTGSGDGVNSVIISIDSPVPVQQNGSDRVAFSIHAGLGTEAIKWVRLVDGAENVVGWQDKPISIDGVRSFEVTATGASAGAGWLNTTIELLVDLSETTTFQAGGLLAERNHLGGYFDGDTVRGGWLIDSSSVSDYRWSGSANSSASIFAEDYERTKAILQELLFEVFPITEVSKYNIVAFNAIPGF